MGTWTRASFRAGLIMVAIFSFVNVSSVIAADSGDQRIAEQIEEASDPWEPFNSKMFSFNHDILDRHVLKPIATGWDFVVPDVVQRSLRNAIDNTNAPSRIVNSLAQGKVGGAGRELARFTINSTIGLGGFLDLAREGFHIEKSDEDTGQTLGFYGVGTGPYLVLPFLPATDIRDGLGSIVDAAMNPLNYLTPYAAGADAATTAGLRASPLPTR